MQMLMEAVMVSLRDWESQQRKEQQAQHDTSDSSSPEKLSSSSPKDDSNITNETLPSDKDHLTDSDPDIGSTASAAVQKDSITASTCLDHGNCSSSDHADDVSAKTRASIVVQRSTSGNSLEGLIQKWGSFLKSSR